MMGLPTRDVQLPIAATLAAVMLVACPDPAPKPSAAVVAVAPSAASLLPGASYPFTATVTGTGDARVTWSVQEPSGGSATQAGVYTAPPGEGTFHVVATSVADPTKSDSAVVTVSATPVVVVAVTPESATVAAGGAQSFTCTVTGTADTACAWSVRESGGGTVSSSGSYEAPSSSGTYHVLATSQADPSKSATATVTVTAGGEPTIAQALTAYAGRKTFFGHQSIGGNVLRGVDDLAAANGVAVTRRYRGDLAGYNGGSDTEVGDNGQPLGKVDDFKNRLMAAYGAAAQFAMMKLCYVDFSYSFTAQQIFDHYRDGLAQVKAAHPGVTIVHMTAPLCNGADAGGDPQSALRRDQYNQMIRAQYQGREPLFDIALSEATDSAGVVQTKVLALAGSPRVQVVSAEWNGDDNCHLGSAGQQHVGGDLLKYLASLPDP